MNPTQTRLDTAVAAHRDSHAIPEELRPSIRDIALDNQVNNSTLAYRLSGSTKPVSEAHDHQRALTDGEEDALIEYIRRQSLMGHPPPSCIVYETAEAIRQNRLPPPSSPLQPLGKNWLSKFRSRHPKVSSVWSRQLDTSRSEAVTVENLAPWFAEVGMMVDRHRYKPENIYNMDETGHGIGLTQSTRVLVVRDYGAEGKGMRKSKASKATSGKQEWVTTIECVSASGCALPPLVIFKADNLNTRWIPEGPEVSGWRWTTSNSGWTNDTLGFDWLEHVFEPSTVSPSKQRRLLILDGHGSHVKGRFIAFCILHGIDLMVLPAHTSHKTQPLDVGIFGPLKAAMARLTDKAATYDHGRIPKDVWASQLAATRALSMTEHNIHVGWRETGLYPFRPDRLLKSIPSASTPTPMPSRQPLAPLPVNHLALLRTCPSPMKDSVAAIITEAKATQKAFEASRARETVLERENQGLRDAAQQRKKKRAGFTVANLHTHVFTAGEVLLKAVTTEALTASRKRKGKGGAVPDGDQGGAGDVHTSQEDV